MAIDLVEKYLPYVDEIFTRESKKSLLTNQDFSWEGAKAVKIYKVSTSSMGDYDRAGSEVGQNGRWSRYGSIGNIDATTERFELKNDRSFTFVIDKLDADETANALNAAAALARQQREVVIPEVDTYTYGVMTEGAGHKPEAVELTADNIYDEILKAGAALDDADAPETGRQLVVTPQVYKLMKRCKDITMETNIGNDLRIKGVIANLDGANVLKIPETRLPKGFGFMLAHPCATVAPTKLADYKTHVDPPGVSGNLVEGRICYDAFILENKAKAIYYQAQPVAEE